MNKPELIQTLKDTHNLSKPEATKCVEIFFGEMAEAPENGDGVEIRGCAAFMSSRMNHILAGIQSPVKR